MALARVLHVTAADLVCHQPLARTPFLYRWLCGDTPGTLRTMTTNIKAECSQRLLTEMIQKVDGFKILCVDSFGMKVVSSCLKMSDINDSGVATVENVELAREPLPDMECIYFVQPCMVNSTVS